MLTGHWSVCVCVCVCVCACACACACVRVCVRVRGRGCGCYSTIVSTILWFLPPNLPVSTLEGEENESKLRGVFVECREVISEPIINDLAGYRQKRVIGMAGMFGDHMVTSKLITCSSHGHQCVDHMLITWSPVS